MYLLLYEKESLNELEKLESTISRRIVEKIEKLAVNPLSCDIKKLKGSDCYRLRVGDYRVIFIFEANFIKILKVGHRKSIYED